MKTGYRHKRCRQHHELTDENTWVRPSDGKRYCRICRINWRERYRSNLDEEGKPRCKLGVHVASRDNKRKSQCLACLEDDELLYDSELGAPLFWADGDKEGIRFEWGYLTQVSFF